MRSIARRPGIRILEAVFLSAIATLFISAAARAVTPIVQSYSTESSIIAGSLVSVSGESANKVIPATIDNVQSMLGIAINPDNSNITLSTIGENAVTVATSGTYPVLVSDLNGTIEEGDSITASPISGIGMKATSNTRVVGVVQTPLTAQKESSYKTADGTEHSIILGEVEILVDVSAYYKESERTLIPQALQQVANSIGGRQVASLPIIVSLVIFVITLIIVVSIIFSMVRSSIISVGRNPMAQSAVYRNVIQLSALVVGILGIASFAIYLILTRL